MSSSRDRGMVYASDHQGFLVIFFFQYSIEFYVKDRLSGIGHPHHLCFKIVPGSCAGLTSVLLTIEVSLWFLEGAKVRHPLPAGTLLGSFFLQYVNLR